MRALIVDDERLARRELHKLCDAYPEIEDLIEVSGAQEAIEYLNENKVDLLFLDIQMPGKTGFELLEELDRIPKVIFVTAFNEHAIKAFEYNALDYLLKPVEEKRFAEAMSKIINDTTVVAAKEEISDRLGTNDRVFVKDGDKCWFVQLRDIVMFESEGNYVKVYFEGHKPLILRSLNNLEKKLNQRKFFRANRKFIINLDWVEGIESWFNGGLLVKLKNGEQVEISRRQSSKLKDMMSL
ncbi:MAG: LytTR family DNA-binding domain-containing protein [Vicingaceae bacterium]